MRSRNQIDKQLRRAKVNEFLPQAELFTLTGYIRASAQAVWLKEHGIAHRLDGRRVIVSRLHVRAWLEGRPIVQSAGLNLSAIK